MAAAEVVVTPRIDLRYAVFAVEVRPSCIHRWGVFALERIPARRKVIEYTGERISRRETKRRSARQHVYLFELDAYWCLDGAAGGSGAELINHSCEPNLSAAILKGHILYMSRRVIVPGEELTVDYHLTSDIETISCRCGTASCRGTVNVGR